MYCHVIALLCFSGLVFTLPHKSHISKIRSLKSNEYFTKGERRLGIYDGTNTTIENHPFLVGILKNDELLCAGAILSDRWVIVLADCVCYGTKSQLKVVAGSSDGTTGTTYSVKKIVQHPDYDCTDTFDYDYTLLKVKGSFTWGDSVGNVSLPSADLTVSTALQVVGYGDTNDVEGSPAASGSMYQGTMKWQKKTICTKDYEDYEISFTDRMGCAYNKGKTTLCSGDWGDPFFKSGVLYGLFAAGASEGWCTSSARPVIVADIFPVVSWIQEYTGATVSL